MLRMDPHVENFSEFCHTFRRFHTIDIPYNIGFPTGVVNAGRALSRILCVYVCDGGGWGGRGGGDISQYIRGEAWGSSDSVFSNVVS